MSTYCLTVSCPAQRGIVAAITSFLAEHGCNITDSSQFDDVDTDHFFMRISFISERGLGVNELSQSFAAISQSYQMQYALHDECLSMKVVVMVSRFGHCLNDLLYRVRIGALPIEIVAVISNHEDFKSTVQDAGIPFHCIPVTRDNKPDAEARIMQVVQSTNAELVVLARYMQILSDEMCQRMSGRIINIHHSFLPSFKGAKPYNQAFERGVKLIGATSHYVTAELDEGPIIEQDVVRVTHAQSASDFVSLGRDVESQVLARAVHAHAHHRVFLNGQKTIVFPASPGSYSALRTG